MHEAEVLEGTAIVVSDPRFPGRTFRRRRGYAPIEQPQLWERQPGEPAAAYRGFSAYRDMPPEERTLSKAAKQVGVSPGTIKDWAQRNAWGIRVDAWDQEVDRLATNKRLRDTVAMDERHANTAMLMQSKVIERLRTVEPKNLSNRDLDRWLEKATRIERMARGKSDGSPLVNVGVNVSQQQAQQQGQAQRAQEPTTPARRALEQAIEQNPSALREVNTTVGELLELVDRSSFHTE